jgi:hypothetical protein
MGRVTTDRVPPGGSAELFGGLFDDASLFPPGSLPMRAAVAGHVRHASAWYHSLTGPFVCPETRLDELRAVLTAANLLELDLALVVTGGATAVIAATDAVAADPRLRLRAIEVPAVRNAGQTPGHAQAPDPAAGQTSGQASGTAEARDAGPVHGAAEVGAVLDTALLAGAACYIEIPLALLADPAVGSEVLAIVDGRGYRPKLRTGGLAAAAFPDERTLAAALWTVTDRNVPFKCTAGLHHAVRHTAADTGFEHHGFLNVLLAVGAAVRGASTDDIEEILALREAALVAGQILALDADSVADIRSLFTSFGTCSVDEPVADLTGLGLISQS